MTTLPCPPGSFPRPLGGCGPRIEGLPGGTTITSQAPDVAQFGFGDILGGLGDVVGALGPAIPGIGGIIGALGGAISGGDSSCPPGFAKDAQGRCIQTSQSTTVTIPGSPGIITPAERGGSVAASQMVAPSLSAVNVHKCPRFANGKTGILWFSPMTNQIVCLPRGTNGSGFGLVRKNKPRAKAVISAADAKLFRKVDSMQKKIQKVARGAGLKGCNLR